MRSSNATTVYILQQWHLSPDAQTFQKDPQSFPQFENQYAIFRQLDYWVRTNAIDKFYAEGCEGEMSPRQYWEFNGWTTHLLKDSLQNKYDEILTHALLKLAVKYPDEATVYCGDDMELIKKNLIAFSDLRGLVGFYQRIYEFPKDSKDLKSYTRAAAQVLDMDLQSDTESVLIGLKNSIKLRIERIQELIALRNQKFVEEIQKQKKSHVAVVIGGLHTKDLTQKLSAQGLNYKVLTPKGYKDDAEALLKTLAQKFK